MTHALSEVGRLMRVVLKHPRDAFVDAATIASQWQALHFTAPPDLGRAAEEYDRLVDILRGAGARVEMLPPDARTTLDSLYVRDASLVCARGVILCAMGKAAREGESAAQADYFARVGVPVAGVVHPPGRIEGGDVAWLDARTVIVGLGYRTNVDGLRQFREILGPSVEIITVPLPHWRGESDVMHLMSLISPVDQDLAVVHSPLLPVPFRQDLLARGIRFVEVPEEEFASMGTNVLTLAPRRCLMLTGNPKTRASLERAGAEVIEYEGLEISLKGGGGPTCLTRPLERAPV